MTKWKNKAAVWIMSALLLAAALVPLVKTQTVRAADVPLSSLSDYIIFDLRLGSVTINASTYSGWVYDNKSDSPTYQTCVNITNGKHESTNKYYIFQSEESDYVNGKIINLPNHPLNVAALGATSWANYLKNKSYITDDSKAVENVIAEWDTAAAGWRTHTNNIVNVSSGGTNTTFDVTIDDIWAYDTGHKYSASRDSGGFTFNASSAGKMTLTLVGDSRVNALHYNGDSATATELHIVGSGTLTAAAASAAARVYATDNNLQGENYWCSAIGGDDGGRGDAYGLKFFTNDGNAANDGIVFAGTTWADNCTAIGAGGNDPASITINGGTVIAIAATSGTAIGGGIGYHSAGGVGTVTIYNGDVCAINYGTSLYDMVSSSATYKQTFPVPAAAIGGGSSVESNGNTGTVTIYNGVVYAESVYGTAIGGGGSSTKAGGAGNVTIYGGQVTAISRAGSVRTRDAANANDIMLPVQAGASIGGGTGRTAGGSATVTIGNETTHTGPTLNTGSIGGGKATNSTRVGAATVTINGGTVHGQVVMASGTDAGGNPINCSFLMTGGTIDNKNNASVYYNDGTITTQQKTYAFLEPNGGAVSVLNGKATIKGGTIKNAQSFIENNASATPGGGAVYVNAGTFEMTGGTIEKCTGTNGGAVLVTNGTVTVDGTDNVNGADRTKLPAIQNNTASAGGGGVMAIGAGAEITVTNATIQQNTAANGGGIYAGSGGTITLNAGTSVYNNTATADGGGAYAAGGTITLNGTASIIQNEAQNGGGAYVIDGTFTMNNGTIHNNTATVNGGGAYVAKQSTGGTITVYNGSVTENKAQNGGAVYANGGSFTMANGSMNSNIAYANGGAVYAASGGTVTMKNGSMNNNTASQNGGAVFADGGDFTMENGSMNTNTATLNGGAVYAASGSTVTMMDGSMNNNTASANGGAVFADGGSFTMQKGSMNENEATLNGGAVYAAGGTVTMESGTMNNNTASQNGGAVYAYGGNFVMKNGEMNINEAQFGGAVYAAGGTVTMEDGEMNGNAASASGGAVFADSGDFIMKNGKMNINSASENGGAVYAAGGTVTMENGNMDGNIAQNGGGVFAAGGEFTMHNGSVSANTATGDGGGAVYSTGGNITIYHGTLNSNKAIREATALVPGGKGGAVYMSGTINTELIMESGKMCNNYAAEDGGAIFAEGGTLYIGLEDCRGQIMDEHDNVTDENNGQHTLLGTGRHHPRLDNNTAEDTGGGISISKKGDTLAGVVHFYCGTALGNKAKNKGLGLNVFMDGGIFYYYEGCDIGVPHNPDLVIIGGQLVNRRDNAAQYITLMYHEDNMSAVSQYTGMAMIGSTMNLPDGTYFFENRPGYSFFGWTARGKGEELLVTSKTQYIQPGDAVEIRDKEGAQTSSGLDTYDGKEDGIMHLYALWVPDTSNITYYYISLETGMREEFDPQGQGQPTYKTIQAEQNVFVSTTPPPGYAVAGWYVYQDPTQNANLDWVGSFVSNNQDLLDTETLKRNGRYILCDENGLLTLTIPEFSFGHIIVVAQYVPRYVDLTITKTVDASADPNQTFLFRIVGTANNADLGNQRADDVDMTVAISGNGSKKIIDLPVGTYTVTEITDWSWRYASAAFFNGGVPTAGGEVLMDPNGSYTFSFTGSRANPYWLSGDSREENWWGNLVQSIQSLFSLWRGGR